MGTHNGEATIKTAVQSIQNQTEPDWEFIICDDCSTDNTWSILQSIAALDSRIKLLQNSQQGGLSLSLNKCLAQAQAPLIARMDDDDVSQPHRFEAQIQALDKNPEIALTGCNAHLFSEPGHYQGFRKCPERPTAQQIFNGKNFIHPTILIRRQILLNVGGYNIAPYALRCEDFDLWCKLYAHGYRGINVQQPLLDYHESPRNIQHRNAQQHRNVHQVMKVWRKDLPLTTTGRIYSLIPLIKSWLPQSILNLRYRKLLVSQKEEESDD
ncbi:glycosyltransferase [Paucilactobacillus hokkaidonensis]|nr:glycosyltransferase [Paucilactobacillus hokkaidonensis]